MFCIWRSCPRGWLHMYMSSPNSCISSCPCCCCIAAEWGTAKVAVGPDQVVLGQRKMGCWKGADKPSWAQLSHDFTHELAHYCCAQMWCVFLFFFFNTDSQYQRRQTLLSLFSSLSAVQSGCCSRQRYPKPPWDGQQTSDNVYDAVLRVRKEAVQSIAASQSLKQPALAVIHADQNDLLFRWLFVTTSKGSSTSVTRFP